jgi:hypothetical protein
LATSLFKKNGNTDPYGADRNRATGQLGINSGLYDNLRQSSASLFNAADPAFQKTFGRVRNLLETDPYTDSYSAAQLAGATAGTERAYQAAKANLADDLAQRGLSESGLMTGGLGAIENGRASILAGAGNDLAMRKIDDQRERALQLLGIEGGVRSQALGEEEAALGAQDNNSRFLASLFSNLGQGELDRRLRQEDSFNSLLSGLGSAAGSYYGSLGRK